MKKEHIYKCRCCKCDIENTDDLFVVEVLSEKTNKTTIKRYHKTCYENMKKNKEDWDRLYDYIRYDVLHMEKGKALSKTLRNRLQSLRFGEYQIKGKKETVVYTYEQMYYTFIICKTSIQNGLKANKIIKDVDISNYIMAIILNNINDVCNRMENRKKADESLNEITKTITTNKYDYVKKESSNVGKILDDLW